MLIGGLIDGQKNLTEHPPTNFYTSLSLINICLVSADVVGHDYHYTFVL